MKKTLLGLILISAWGIASALPFNITAVGTLPTSIILGDILTVEYTIQNNTLEQRNNNYIKQFPANTQQVTGPGLCGTTFDLAPKGNPGDSCLLELAITAPTDGCNPPLLACFPGGITCAGTPDVLNVVSASGPTSNIRGVTGGKFGSDALAEVSWNNLQTWAAQTLGLSSAGNVSSVNCVGAGDSAVCAAGLNGPSAPFISQSYNGGIIWAPVTGLTNSSPILSTSCTTGGFCIAAGYVPSSSPYLALSTGTQGTWTDTGFTGFTATPSGQFNGAACAANGSICLAVGVDNTHAYPYIIQSTTPATASSWIVANLPTYLINSFNSASCTTDGTFCITGGTQNIGNTGNCSLLNNSNQGTTWTCSTPSTTGTAGLIFNSTSCTGSGANGWCIAVGNRAYIASPPLPADGGRVFQTINSGAAWTTASFTTSSTPSYPTTTVLNGSSCTGTVTNGICVAVGSTNPGMASDTPLIVVSTNGGTPTAIPNSRIIGLPTNSILQSVSCSGNRATATCVAVGTDLTNAQSLLIESTDGGQHWAVNNSSATTGGTLNTVSVTGG